MPEEEDEEIDKILEEDLSKEEQRKRRTEELNNELGDYEVKQANNYDVYDAIEDLQETKDIDNSDEVERRVRAQMKLEEEKTKARKKAKETSHDFHETYSMISGITLVTLGFLYSSMFLSLAILGVLYIMYQETELLPGEKDSKFARLVSNHPKFYIAGVVVTTVTFLGAGYKIPKLEGVISTVATALVGV